MSLEALPGSQTLSILDALKDRTKSLHTEAERSGVIRDILQGNAQRESYVLFLRNLLPAYQEMESGIEKLPGLAELANYKLERAGAIVSDLTALSGVDWQAKIPLLSAGSRYATRVVEASKGDGTLLLAHAYARYLGDLSGGLILQKLLARSLNLASNEMAFYQFPRHADLAVLKKAYRETIEHLGSAAVNKQCIVEEAALAFSLNIALSSAVQQAAPYLSAANGAR